MRTEYNARQLCNRSAVLHDNTLIDFSSHSHRQMSNLMNQSRLKVLKARDDMIAVRDGHVLHTFSYSVHVTQLTIQFHKCVWLCNIRLRVFMRNTSNRSIFLFSTCVLVSGFVEWGPAKTCGDCPGPCCVLHTNGGPVASGRVKSPTSVMRRHKLTTDRSVGSQCFLSLSFSTLQGFYRLLEPKVTIRCRHQDVEMVQVRLSWLEDNVIVTN